MSWSYRGRFPCGSWPVSVWAARCRGRSAPSPRSPFLSGAPAALAVEGGKAGGVPLAATAGPSQRGSAGRGDRRRGSGRRPAVRRTAQRSARAGAVGSRDCSTLGTIRAAAIGVTSYAHVSADSKRCLRSSGMGPETPLPSAPLCGRRDEGEDVDPNVGRHHGRRLHGLHFVVCLGILVAFGAHPQHAR